MKNKEHSKRLALTLLFTGILLFFLLITFLAITAAGFLLIRFNALKLPSFETINSARVMIISLRAILLFILAFFFVNALTALFFGHVPLKPINILLDSINRLAAGDFKARIDFGDHLRHHPSFAELTDSFNRMAEELQGTEMLRSDFINNFSHEFKTPIVSIAGFAKLLKHGNLTPEQQAEYIDIIEEESLRLSQMATNVLNLTKVENQTILTDIMTYNLSEQLRSCILLLGGKWEKKNIDFVLDFSEHDISANEELLKQVWINLIDNAIKFSPERGTIELKIEETETALSVSILNFGSEIPLEQQAKIFNKFYQADESHSTEGNGVGLAIVKQVAELHNAAVTVKSEHGATMFTVTLPKKQE